MAQFQFNANSAFAKIFNANAGSYLALAEAQEITDPNFLQRTSTEGVVFSTGQRSNGSEILYVRFTSLDGYNRPVEFKLDVPSSTAAGLKPGDVLSKAQAHRIRPISNGPGREPRMVLVVDEPAPEQPAE